MPAFMIGALLDRILSVLQRRLCEIAYAAAWRLGASPRASTGVQRTIFTRIHDQNLWRDPESRSGPGSTAARGASLRPALIDLLDRQGVKTLLDAPCGDFHWMRDVMEGLDVTYIGVDIVASLVAGNQAAYGKPGRQFACLDLTRDPLPRADLILCRDALVHLSFADIAAALRNFRDSGSRLLLTTTFIDTARNEDIRTGGWRRLNLQLEPFGFPEPIATIEDLPAGGIAPGKRLALWELQ